MADERYAFVAEWYDVAASLIRTYLITYYPKDKTIEMVDLKTKKLFLKRCEYPSVTLKDLYLGAVVNIYSRQLKIVDFGDVFTRKALEVKKERTFAMIKPDCYLHIGKILDIIENSGFVIGNIRMAKMSLADAEEFYGEHKGKPFYPGLTNFMSSDLIVGLELVAEGAIAKWRKTIGPTNCDVARAEAPNSIRALFGQEGVRNACHGSDSPVSAQRELDFFFGEKSRLKPTALMNNCSCCIIKPHIIAGLKTGKIIDYILSAGFEISALQMFFLDKATSEEFLEVYKGVLPEYSGLSAHLATGPCIALEIRQENAVAAFRDLCGPHDPEIAKTLRPKTIRATFGIDRIKNAVHCTDLPEDGPLEVEYFFSVLQQK